MKITELLIPQNFARYKRPFRSNFNNEFDIRTWAEKLFRKSSWFTKFSNLKKSKEIDIYELIEKLEYCKKNNSFNTLNKFEMKQVSLNIFEIDQKLKQDSPNYSNRIKSVDYFFEYIDESNEARLINTLFAVLLFSFNPKNTMFIKINNLIKKKKNLLKRKWQKVVSELNFFDHDLMQKLFYDLITNNQFETFINKNRLLSYRSSDLFVYLAKTSSEKIVNEVRNSNFNNIDNFVQFLTNGTTQINNRFGIPALYGLLFGFAEFKLNKDIKDFGDTKKKITDILLASYQDPRINADMWPRFSVNDFNGDETRKKCLQVIKSWLIQANIETFLKIINKTSQSERADDDARQFVKRAKLWRGYLDKELILDVCVALGHSAEIEALKINDDNNDIKLTFSRLKSGKSDQSVLIMRFQNCIVVEWSHDGAMVAWNYSDEEAPELHLYEYRANSLRIDIKDDSKDRVRVVHQGKSWNETIAKELNKVYGVPNLYSKRFGFF